MRAPEFWSGGGGGLAPILLFSSYRYLASGMAAVFHFIYPILVVLSGYLLREKVKKGALGCALLCSLGIRDGRMDEAIALVRNKQDNTGRWLLENAYGSDRLLVPIGRLGEQSKWLTLRAMRVLKRLCARA